MIPGEMLSPPLLSWMIKRHSLVAKRIQFFGFVVLVVIASLARECQIFLARWPILIVRPNVFNGECTHGKASLTAAILAAFPSALPHEATQMCRYVFFSHQQVV